MNSAINKFKWRTFLFDVLICSLGAYGGPEAHYGVITDQMVIKKNYLNEEELLELIALTSVLPGPSSTQTIVAIGYKVGGPLLALLAFLVWALPAIAIMTTLSFLYTFLSQNNLDASNLRYIAPMAVGFIAVASFRIGRKVIKNKLTLFLFLFGASFTYFFRQAWAFPLALLIGGLMSVLFSKEKEIWNKVKLDPPWKYLIAFSIFAIGSLILNAIFNHQIIYIFSSFYRYGYLIIGGGQVVIPYMFSDLVNINHYMLTQEFLTGFGLVQGMPGPMFSFSAYVGGMATRGNGVLMQILGAITAALGIFLPGVLLIYFVYPIWENLKKVKGIKISLTGVTSVAAGLIAIAAFILMKSSGFTVENIIVFTLTVILLLTKKIPAPIIVAFAIIAGFLI